MKTPAVVGGYHLVRTDHGHGAFLVLKSSRFQGIIIPNDYLAIMSSVRPNPPRKQRMRLNATAVRDISSERNDRRKLVEKATIVRSDPRRFPGDKSDSTGRTKRLCISCQTVEDNPRIEWPFGVIINNKLNILPNPEASRGLSDNRIT